MSLGPCDHVAACLHPMREQANLSIEKDDFELAPFNREGGVGKVHQIFGSELNKLIEELNGTLAAREWEEHGRRRES